MKAWARVEMAVVSGTWKLPVYHLSHLLEAGTGEDITPPVKRELSGCPGWLGRDWVKSAPSWPPGPPPGLLPMLSAKPSARGSDSGVDGPSGEQGPWRGRACLSGQSCGASGTPVPGVGDPSAGLSQCCPHPWGHGVPRAYPPKGPLTQERCCGCELLLSMNATC